MQQQLPCKTLPAGAERGRRRGCYRNQCDTNYLARRHSRSLWAAVGGCRCRSPWTPGSRNYARLGRRGPAITSYWPSPRRCTPDLRAARRSSPSAGGHGQLLNREACFRSSGGTIPRPVIPVFKVVRTTQYDMRKGRLLLIELSDVFAGAARSHHGRATGQEDVADSRR